MFEGRRQLIAYFHMWPDGLPFEDQCEGCTLSTCHMQMQDYLHARDVTYAGNACVLETTSGGQMLVPWHTT